jgi:hypothetical protein
MIKILKKKIRKLNKTLKKNLNHQLDVKFGGLKRNQIGLNGVKEYITV